MRTKTQSSNAILRILDRSLVFLIGMATLFVWEAAVRIWHVPDYILPRPSAVVSALITGIERGLYPVHFAATMTSMLIGCTIGSTVGVLLGAAIVEFRIVERIIYPYVLILQSLPKIALAPLFVMWLGYGLPSKIVMVALISLFPMLVNTITGLRSADRDRIDIVRAMTASRADIFWHVRLPSAAPSIFGGLQLVLVFSLMGALVSEFVGSDYGLGNLIEASQVSLDTAGMFAVLVILAVTGLVLSSLLRLVRRHVVFWEAPHDGEPS
jgi:NitT/TauT family transport system permease protein